MHGNVWEWCSDWYGAYPTGGGVIVDYQGPPSGDRRVLRGGSWGSYGQLCRSAQRFNNDPGARLYLYGLRVVCVRTS